jgi:tetratricopeptide (TPR) repeat protein
MSARFRVTLIGGLAAAALLASEPAAAQSGMIGPPDKLPRAQRGDRTQNLDFLFEALKTAPDRPSAKIVEERIWALWMTSTSDTANLLMTRVKTAVEVENLDLALQLLDAIVQLKPDYVEAWNRRATIYFMRKDYSRSLADLRQILAREPRHFGALSGLGLILQELGEDKRALDIYRRVQAIHPHLPRVPELIKSLTEKVDGRDI